MKKSYTITMNESEYENFQNYLESSKLKTQEEILANDIKKTSKNKVKNILIQTVDIKTLFAAFEELASDTKGTILTHDGLTREDILRITIPDPSYQIDVKVTRKKKSK